MPVFRRATGEWGQFLVRVRRNSWRYLSCLGECTGAFAPVHRIGPRVLGLRPPTYSLADGPHRGCEFFKHRIERERLLGRVALFFSSLFDARLR